MVKNCTRWKNIGYLSTIYFLIRCCRCLLCCTESCSQQKFGLTSMDWEKQEASLVVARGAAQSSCQLLFWKQKQDPACVCRARLTSHLAVPSRSESSMTWEHPFCVFLSVLFSFILNLLLLLSKPSQACDSCGNQTYDFIWVSLSFLLFRTLWSYSSSLLPFSQPRPSSATLDPHGAAALMFHRSLTLRCHTYRGFPMGGKTGFVMYHLLLKCKDIHFLWVVVGMKWKPKLSRKGFRLRPKLKAPMLKFNIIPVSALSKWGSRSDCKWRYISTKESHSTGCGSIFEALQ